MLLVLLVAHYLLRTTVVAGVDSRWCSARSPAARSGCSAWSYGTSARLGTACVRPSPPALLIAMSLVLSEHLVDFVPWFSILGISYPLVFGLRRA